MSVRLDFGSLSPDQFERLCHELILIDEPTAKKLRPPDGGCDTVVFDESGSAKAAWQAKRFIGAIKFTQCEESLRRACDVFSPSTYTFLFAKELTEREIRIFRDRLVVPGKSENVVVDFRDAAWIESKIRDHTDRRLEEQYFNAAISPTAAALIERSIRAGGGLWGPSSIVERSEAIAEHLQVADPDYTYAVSAGTDIGKPPGSSVLRMEVSSGENRIALDAIPRENEVSTHRPPKLKLRVDTSKLDEATSNELSRVLRRGGEIKVGAAGSIELENFPTLMAQLHPDSSERPKSELTIALKPTLNDLQLRVDLQSGSEHFDFPIDLQPIEPVDDFDVSYLGKAWDGCFEFKMHISHSHAENSGSIGFEFGYRKVEADAASHASALRATRYLYSSQSMRLTSRKDGTVLGDHPIDPDLDAAQSLEWVQQGYEHLTRVERQLGRRLSWPDSAGEDELEALFTAGNILESGECRFTFSVVFLKRDSSFDDSKDFAEPKAVLIEEDVVLDVFGQPVPLGRFRFPLGNCVVRESGTATEADSMELRIVPDDAPSRSVKGLLVGG